MGSKPALPGELWQHRIVILMKTICTYLTIGAACLLLQSAYATLLFEEGFNYPIGALGGNGAWLGGSTGLKVASGDLTYPGLADAANPGNELTDTQGTSGSMTVPFSAANLTSGSVYYSFLAECTTLPTANSYLTDLLPAGGSPNGSGDPLAVYVGQQVAGSTFKVGVRHQGIGSGATYATSGQFTVGTVNLFVVKYTFGSGGSVSLFVNPTAGGSEPTPDVTVGPGGTEAANLDLIGFKVNSGTSAGNWVFDTLRVGDAWASVTPLVPEPSSAALTGLGLLGLAFWRRLSRPSR